MALTQPQSGEDCFSIIDKTMRSRLFTALCVDSVASMVPLAELEGSIEDQQVTSSVQTQSFVIVIWLC